MIPIASEDDLKLKYVPIEFLWGQNLEEAPESHNEKLIDDMMKIMNKYKLVNFLMKRAFRCHHFSKQNINIFKYRSNSTF